MSLQVAQRAQATVSKSGRNAITIAKASAVVCQATKYQTITDDANVTYISRRQAALSLLAVAGLNLAIPSPGYARPASVVTVSQAANQGERDVFTTSTGVKYSEVSKGTGDAPRTGDLVLVDVIGKLEDGQVFLDTRQLGTPLAFQVGTTNKYVPEGLSQAVEGMNSGSIRLAVLPPSLGYGDQGAQLPGAKIPPNSVLYYEVELLRCETFTLGLACCSEKVFTGNQGSCIKKPGAEPGAVDVSPVSNPQ